MDVPPELGALRSFHGHLGVYVTLGMRMGEMGKRRFGHYKGLTATVQWYRDNDSWWRPLREKLPKTVPEIRETPTAAGEHLPPSDPLGMITSSS